MKTHRHIVYLVENTNTQSVAELVRAVVLKEKILFFPVYNTMSNPMVDLEGIRQELKRRDEISIRSCSQSGGTVQDGR